MPKGRQCASEVVPIAWSKTFAETLPMLKSDCDIVISIVITVLLYAMRVVKEYATGRLLPLYSRINSICN